MRNTTGQYVSLIIQFIWTAMMKRICFWGTLENGVLNKPSGLENSKPIEGNIGDSGKSYLEIVKRFFSEDLEITNPGSKGERTRALIMMKGIISAGFLGEDESGNFYLQNEINVDPMTGKDIGLAVQKCNSLGKVMQTLYIPYSPYWIGTVKMLSVNKHGTIFQCAPGKDNIILKVYSDPSFNESPAKK